MRELLTGRQMQEADAYTMQELHIPSLELMERAATAVARRIMKKIDPKKRILIVCGSGNNGGDGFAIARLLVEKGYRKVDVVSVGDPARDTQEVTYQKGQLIARGKEILEAIPDGKYALVVDCVFGVGLTREITGDFAAIIEQMNAIEAMKLAVDMPSGISADSGQVLGCAFRADETITFAYEKIGQVLDPGRTYCGKVRRADIGIVAPEGEEEERVVCWTRGDVEQVLPRRREDSNKGSNGRLLIVAGSRNMAGAAYLSALAAYRSGVGYVTIYTPECNREILQRMLPEAVLATYEEGSVPLGALDDLYERADAVVVGPGLGMSSASQMLLRRILAYERKPMLIDADALNLISVNPDLYELMLQGEAVITPHPGEMSRLCGREIADILKQPVETARSAVQGKGITCVLKTARTVIAADKKQVAINTSGCSAMAKAGSGDVLSGVIGGLMARKVPDYEAAAMGVYLHGLAGQMAAREIGEEGVLARDIANELPRAWKKVTQL